MDDNNPKITKATVDKGYDMLHSFVFVGRVARDMYNRVLTRVFLT